MSSLVACFEEFINERNLIKRNNDHSFSLKEDDYKTTVLASQSNDLVVFKIGNNSHSSFVKTGYNKNCDYIFIKIKEDKINFILCELKKSYNHIERAFLQLNQTIPLVYYLINLLTIHFEQYRRLKINYKKVLLIKKQDNPDTMKNTFQKEDDVFIFEGDEFALKEFLDAE